MLTEAVILTGGQGTRADGAGADTPTPLPEVGGKPFVDFLVWNLARYGIERVVIVTGDRNDPIVEHVGDGSALGVSATVIVGEEAPGDAGAARLALAEVRSDRFLLLRGEQLFDLNYLDLALMARTRDADVACALRAVPDVSGFGRATLDDGLLTAFGERGCSGPGLVDGGVCVVRREALEVLPPGPLSLEAGVLARLVPRHRVAGRRYEGFFIDVGVPARLAEARRTVPAWRRKPAVFMDRDGVLNRDFGHVHDPSGFEWMPGAPAAVKWLNDRGVLVIVVTNQSGIGRGYYDEQQFQRFTARIGEQLAEVGAHIDAVYHCPHHPTKALGAYRRDCGCRKPAPGMLLAAIEDWEIDVGASVMIGDSPKDMAAAAAAGVRGVTYAGGDLARVVAEAVAGR